jgi:adenine phosphoribosyltransferase
MPESSPMPETALAPAPANEDIAAFIRTIPDYPKLLLDGPAFRLTVDRIAEQASHTPFDLIAGIEARGFIVAAALSYKLGLGKLMLRKSGKLPGVCVGIDYDLEYGTDRMEMHADAVAQGARILLVDDLLATGGTALAAVGLLRGAGADVVGASFIVDLPDLGGGARLEQAGVPVHALVSYPGH